MFDRQFVSGNLIVRLACLDAMEIHTLRRWIFLNRLLELDTATGSGKTKTTDLAMLYISRCFFYRLPVNFKIVGGC